MDQKSWTKTFWTIFWTKKWLTNDIQKKKQIQTKIKNHKKIYLYIMIYEHTPPLSKTRHTLSSSPRFNPIP